MNNRKCRRGRYCLATLAGDVDGWGGDELLSSYDAERRPLDNRNDAHGTEIHGGAQKPKEKGEQGRAFSSSLIEEEARRGPDKCECDVG